MNWSNGWLLNSLCHAHHASCQESYAIHGDSVSTPTTYSAWPTAAILMLVDTLCYTFPWHKHTCACKRVCSGVIFFYFSLAAHDFNSCQPIVLMAGGRTRQGSLQGSCFLGRRVNCHCAMPPGRCATSTCFLGGWPFLMPPLHVSAATWASRRWIPLCPYHPATTHGIRIHPLGPWIFEIIADHS